MLHESIMAYLTTRLILCGVVRPRMTYKILFKGPRRPYYNPIPGMFFSNFLKAKSIFRSSYTISSTLVACETRLAENDIPPEWNLRMVSLIC